MDVKKDKLVLIVNAKGNVEVRNYQGILIKVAYSGGDAQRADWLNEADLSVLVQTNKGKVKHVSKQGVVLRTIG